MPILGRDFFQLAFRAASSLADDRIVGGQTQHPRRHDPRLDEHFRVLDGDSQARGLVLRSSPGIEDGFPSNRIGLLGAAGAARWLGHENLGDRDWYLVNIRDVQDGRLKQGDVSGRGNFTLGADWECNGIP